MIKRWASWAIKIALTGGALWYLQEKVDLRAAWEDGKSISPLMFFVAFLLQVVQVLICAGRWRLVLRALGADLPFRQACEIFCIGNFFGQVLPGAVGGDAVRMWKTHRAGLALSTSVNSVALERVATVFGLVLLVAVSQPLLLDRLAGGFPVWVFPGLTAAGVAGILFLSLLDRVPRSFHHLRLIRGFAQLAGDSRLLFFRASKALPILLVVVVGHINLALVVYALTIGLNIDVSMLDCVVLVPPVILVATLPISMAGWGPREMAMITAFGFIGVTKEHATALSVLFGAVSVLIALPGGVFWLIAKRQAAPPVGEIGA
ncbi:lysylphosphatidylglycerol synthase transmembrane domain-containing protein [Telmatospirillum sp.]|uniref:lysylphosphatidylglycerol synthase transmembrane domain-containing protein n=1 Tax=Telmatospirillum sp. TaxID=2079197 RepID=UPI00283B02DC|nr:lysylphosphatidylglycerol synthase transmembrane domain-containing protein [Telmatospirillum sp.]MDR3440627.1 lysylphosphatidylglycerol synthase transmembrane domain-containing protein [Telmatospirillum sp.]